MVEWLNSQWKSLMIVSYYPLNNSRLHSNDPFFFNFTRDDNIISTTESSQKLWFKFLKVVSPTELPVYVSVHVLKMLQALYLLYKNKIQKPYSSQQIFYTCLYILGHLKPDADPWINWANSISN